MSVISKGSAAFRNNRMSFTQARGRGREKGILVEPTWAGRGSLTALRLRLRFDRTTNTHVLVGIAVKLYMIFCSATCRRSR